MIRTIATLILASVGPALPDWSTLHPLRLHAGINLVENIAGDGKPGNISLDWRENGNAWGYDIYMVRAGGSVVTIDGSDRLTDRPHTGEDVITSVRFARGPHAGRITTFALVAERSIKTSVPDPAPTSIKVYVLQRSADPLGTPYVFNHVAEIAATRQYCNAEMALKSELGFPLSKSYSGRMTVSGC